MVGDLRTEHVAESTGFVSLRQTSNAIVELNPHVMEAERQLTRLGKPSVARDLQPKVEDIERTGESIKAPQNLLMTLGVLIQLRRQVAVCVDGQQSDVQRSSFLHHATGACNFAREEIREDREALSQQ